MPAKKKRKKKAKKVKKASKRKSPFCARCEVEDKVQVRMNEGGHKTGNRHRLAFCPKGDITDAHRKIQHKIRVKEGRKK